MKLISFIFIISSLIFSCQNKNNLHNHAQAEISEDKHQHDCIHCGMPSEEFPKWQSKIKTNSGEKRSCSPRCMFISVLDIEVKNVKSIKIREYYNQKEIDAKKAFYVIGSDIIGPMGKDLVPFATEADAKEFMQDHKGKKILEFGQVNLKIIQEMIKN